MANYTKRDRRNEQTRQIHERAKRAPPVTPVADLRCACGAPAKYHDTMGKVSRFVCEECAKAEGLI